MSLLVASKRVAGGRGLARALVRRAPTLALEWDARQKSRFDAVDSGGRRIGVVLPRGAVLRDGDVLVVEDGSLVVVEAVAQPVLVVTARPGAADPALDLSRAAYHLGNRHVPLEIRSDRLVLEPDHVLAELLVRMGLDVTPTSAAFDPESGAYDRAATDRHDHAHGHHADAHHAHAHDDDGAHAHA